MRQRRGQIRKSGKNIFFVRFCTLILIVLISGAFGFYLGQKSAEKKEIRPVKSHEIAESAGKTAGLVPFAAETGKFYAASDVSNLSETETANLKIPKKEKLSGFISGDTDKNGRNETLVITVNDSGEKGHIYILDDEGEKVYDRDDILILPDKVELRNWGDDLHPSFFLIFKEQYTEGYFLRWNGKKYEVPESERE